MFSLVSAAAFAQKGELKTAGEEFDKYNIGRANKLTMATAHTSLIAAKTSIDKAAVNEKTANLPLTYALKGAIYSSLAVEDTVPATSAPLFSTAEAALKKAKEANAADAAAIPSNAPVAVPVAK